MKKIIYFLGCLIVSPCFAKLQAVSFPKTYEDLSFTERMKNSAEGYIPFMDKSAYYELEIIPGEEIYTDSMIAKTSSESEQTKTDEESQTNQPTYNTSNGPTIGGGVVIENNTVTGGSCYPPAKDNHFTNKILTSGRYENISPAFEKALITIFRKEGSCGTIPNDPCGYTCYGIGSNNKCAGIVVKSREEAEDFYYERYWKKYQISKLPDVISTDILLASMASGPGTAMKQFRNFLGIPASSNPVVDEEMVRAVKNYNGDIHNQWMNLRDAFLQKISNKSYGGKLNQGYKNAIELKRKNGCHVRPQEYITR